MNIRTLWLSVCMSASKRHRPTPTIPVDPKIELIPRQQL